MDVVSCGEVGLIADDQSVWRRVQDHLDHLEWDHPEQCWRARPTPPSNSMQFDPDMSTVWANHVLTIHDKGPVATLDVGGKYSLVFHALAAAVRASKVELVHTPTSQVLPGCAHASITLPQDATGDSRAAKNARKDIRLQLSRIFALVWGQPSVLPPPGA